MKTTDLRIGNLVIYEKTTHVVRGVLLNGRTVYSNWINAQNEPYYQDSIENHEPIPLTEEWLIKAGFVRNGRYVNKVFEKGVMQLEWDMFFWVDGNGNIPVNITTVHQLQNLYFALVGEELEFKK